MSPPLGKKAKNAHEEDTGTANEEASEATKSRCLKESRRSGHLTLCINNIDSFVANDGDAAGDWALISGVKWRLWACMEGDRFSSYVECDGGDKDNWHMKCKYWIRLRNTAGRHEIHEDCQLFDADANRWGVRWMKEWKLRTQENGFVLDNSVSLDCELTTIACHVTDGAYGERTRFHDVSFKFEEADRVVLIHANKGFLAANSAFFEAQFFGEFDDKTKDELTLHDVDSDDFASFLKAIAPDPPIIKPFMEFELLRLANRLQSDTLTEKICRRLLDDKSIGSSFTSRLELADELNLAHFRDVLIATATRSDIDEAAQEVNEGLFTGPTCFKLLLRYKSFRA